MEVRVGQRAESALEAWYDYVEGTEPLLKLSFAKMKAVAYPGGDRFKFYDECEQNEFAEVRAAAAALPPPYHRLHRPRRAAWSETRLASWLLMVARGCAACQGCP